MSEFLPFWPKAAVTAASVASGTDQNVYTRALPTNGFTEVVAQIVLDSKVWDGVGNGSIQGIPQLSNDGVTWKDSTTTFAAVSSATSVPYQEAIKITEIGAFMRIKIKFSSSSGTTHLAATVMITGVGRS
jgi:hypothetical protein